MSHNVDIIPSFNFIKCTVETYIERNADYFEWSRSLFPIQLSTFN